MGAKLSYRTHLPTDPIYNLTFSSIFSYKNRISHSMAEFSDLIEALAAMPMYHLLPKQELAPLLSFSRLDPCLIGASTCLSNKSSRLAEKAEKQMKDGSLQDSLAFFTKMFENFDHPDLHNLKFKLPVILGNSNRIPELPSLGPFYGAIFGAQSNVDDLDLIELEPNIDEVVGVEDKVQLLNSWSDDEAARQHIHYYNEGLDKMAKARLKKRILSTAERAGPLKRMKLDYHRLLDHREAELYVIIDQWDEEHTLTRPDDQFSSLKSIGMAVQPITSSTLLSKVWSLLSALFEANKLAEINVEYLQRIQAICSLFIASSISDIPDISILDAVAMDLLLASETILIIMNAGDDRRLHIASNVDRVIECIDVLVGAAIGTSSNQDSSCFQLLGRLVDTVSLTVSKIKVDELTLTQLEYISVHAIFSYTTVGQFDNVRHSLINLMARIFKSYASQRTFIVNEMLINLKRLLLHSLSAQQLRLKSGICVLFFTAFLLRLVQSYDAVSVCKDAKLFSNLPKSKNSHTATDIKRVTIVKNILGIFADSLNIANQISEYFMKNLTDASLKLIFGVFVDDIIALMPSSEWSGAATMIDSIMRVFTTELEANTFPGLVEPFALEIIGKIGLEIHKQRAKISAFCSLDATDKESIQMIANYQNRLLLENREISNPVHQDQEFQYLLLRFFRQYAMLQEQATRKDGEHHIFEMNAKHTAQNVLEEARLISKHLDDMLVMLYSENLTPGALEERESVGKMYVNLILAECLEDAYENYFSILMTSLNSSKAKVATKAIKLMSPLIECDTRLLLTLKVNKSISKLLTGNSPLSRDAVIDLLGKYISESSELIQKYYKAICQRSADNSTLVRRRVIKLMKDMYFECAEVDVRGYIALQFLKHANDIDKIVREAARNQLTELWFTSNISTAETCEVLAWVISSGPSAQELMLQFFSLVDSTLLDRKVRQELKTITSSILAMVIEEIDGVKRQQAILKLSLLSTIVSWDRKLLSFDDFLLLQPYLFEDRDSKSEVCLLILRILKFILRDNRTINKEELARIRDDILKKLTRIEMLELHEAVPILQLIAELMKDNSSIANAMLSTLKMLRLIFSDNVPDDNQSYKCCKLLHLLGCMGAYCDLEAARDIIQKGYVGLLPNETIVSLVVKYLIHFTKSRFPDNVKIAAVKNMIVVCAYHPKIFMSESVLKVLDEVFEQGSPVAKFTAVEGLNEYLVREEKTVSKNGTEMISSKTVKLDVGDFHGSLPQSMHEGISASVIQRYLEPILHLCLVDSSTAAIIPVQFLRLVIKLGFANPKVCISTIIALKCSSNKLVKKIATELHLDLFDRHESLSDRSYADAFKLATEYVKRSIKDAFWTEISFLRSVYKVVNRSYLSKKKFIFSLSKLFNLDLLNSLQESIVQRDTIVFLAINLLVVNYTSLEEVCLLLYHLDRSITLDGIDLSEKITSTVESKSGIGMSMENLQILFIHGQTVLAMIYLRQQLAASYGIGPNIMDTFRPSKPDLELRQAPRSLLVVDYPISELEMGTSLAQPGGFGKVFTRLVLSMKNYTT